DAHVTGAPFPVEAGFVLVAPLNPCNIVAQVGIAIRPVERPAVVESKCGSEHGGRGSGGCGNTGYIVSGTLSLGSTETDRGDKVLEVPVKYLIQADRLAVSILEIRQGRDGCKGLWSIGPVLLMHVIRTHCELRDQIRPEGMDEPEHVAAAR